METRLKRIADKARKDRNEQFTSLTHHLTRELVWKHLSKMPATTASGVDEENLDEAKRTFGDWVDEQIASVHRKGYKAPPVRRVYIPKPGTTKQRPIGVPSIRDRALQGAVAEILSQIYEVDFEPQSFGGRPQLSAHHAVINLQTQVTVRKTKYILNCDLENFFGSVSHEWVMRFLSHRVKGPRILNFVLRWLRAGVMEQGRFQETEIGVPQGGRISVLLSNLYLHYALDLWLNRTIKPRLRGQMEFIRYLDDFVILLEREDDLKRLQEVLPKRLEKFSLRTNESKSQVLKFGAAMAQCHDVLHYLGYTLYRTRNRRGGYKIGFKTEKKLVPKKKRKR